jgi:hypothetical protein
MTTRAEAGYSGTPLLRKLGFRAPLEVRVDGAPEGYAEWLGELPPGLALAGPPERDVAAAHLFAPDQAWLQARLPALREALRPDGFVWVSWPKRASGVPTDLTEDRIRDLALPLGFVDVKVCAVSDVWSGLRLVVRRALRTPAVAPRTADAP